MNKLVATDTTFSAEEIEEIRAKCAGVMDAEGYNQADVARLAGVAYGTFTGWFKGTYAGNNSKVAGEVQIWLSGISEKKQASSRIPRVPDYVETPSTIEFMSALQYAHVLPEIAIIAGGAGISKTTACEQYARTNRNVWLATMDPSSKGTHGMLLELAEILGVTEKSPTKLSKAIVRRVDGTNGLIIIDEAQHLTTEALDQARSIYDRARGTVGLVLVGNETVYAQLEGNGRKAGFAQLFSRIGVRCTQSIPRAEDMCALIAAWDVTEKEEIRYLKAIARKPGALRGMTKCLQLASLLANGEGAPRSIKHIKMAWEKHSSSAA
ncbi:AAA family ATPase [Thalassospira alkalitolerans]|uniref:AAA family ATPase n=1 Tax=Thalassospira alkalitolerans TaxID=1293890 RepID=UPI0030EBF75D|tara:strand:+ start:5318 stop:6286 length:969 start_codon:yes stop_codon:yes gene_type:complete